MSRVRVNIRTLANTKAIRKEKRDGRDVIIVPSATLPDDVVMNGIKYPADEIAKSFQGLEKKPAPLGHPMIGGEYVSALEPMAINANWVGAFNENVRRENGRVFLDKVIDIEVANRTAGGKSLLEAIDKGDPIHTSTGLFCNLEDCADAGFKAIARDIEFDHDAILLNEQGAAKPEQGVGMMVNGAKVTVINSFLEDADRSMEWAVESLVHALERRERASFMDQMKARLVSLFGDVKAGKTANGKEPEMAEDKQIGELSAKVEALAESVAKIPETIANGVAAALKPLTDNLSAMQANEKAKEEAERAELVAKIVKANVLSEAAAKELTINALKELAAKAAPGKAAAINGAPLIASADDDFAGYDLNALIDAKGN
jgi:hypothetical protein